VGFLYKFKSVFQLIYQYNQIKNISTNQSEYINVLTEKETPFK